MILPLFILLLCLCARYRGEYLYEPLRIGAREGLDLLKSVYCSLVALLAAFHMLQQSGFTGQLTLWLTPVCRAVGIPPQVLPIMLVRPFSGSAALAAATDIITAYGADSLIGRTAAVMLGSTETTFYTMTVYLAKVNIKPPKHILLCAVAGDLTGFLTASLFVRLLS